MLKKSRNESTEPKKLLFCILLGDMVRFHLELRPSFQEAEDNQEHHGMESLQNQMMPSSLLHLP